jgi:hypothetical protein
VVVLGARRRSGPLDAAIVDRAVPYALYMTTTIQRTAPVPWAGQSNGTCSNRKETDSPLWIRRIASANVAATL